MHDEVLDVPPIVERRLVLADLEGEVTQGGAFGLRDRVIPHRRVGPVTSRSSDLTNQSRGTLRDGFAVIAVAIRREPVIFTLSTLGSLLFGALTVADAWVLGWATDHVVFRR